MYSVYAKKGGTKVCIYNDVFTTPEVLALSPKLELQESAAGTFKIKLPGSNAGYDFVERLTTEIIVEKEGTEIWSGRVMKEDTDFWKHRSIECEGELAYLNDTTQPQAEYHDISPRNLLQTFINIHNAKVSSDKRFTIGSVTVTDPNDSLYRYTNYESTLEAINDKLCKRLGGYLQIRKVNGTRYLDYLADHPNTSSQPIEFTRNLLDFTKSFDSTEYCTVILPLGARLEESSIEPLEEYTTVEDFNGGSPYVVNQNAVNTYGWICKVVHWDDVEDPEILLRKAREYLSDKQFDSMQLEVKAVDLHYTDKQIEAIKLSNKLRVVSKPHGLDRYFPLTKMSIPLDNPADTTFTMGDTVKISYTQRSNEERQTEDDKIEQSRIDANEGLNIAKRNADQLIRSFTNGYITIAKNQNGSQELFVSDYQGTSPQDILDHASRYWRWNLNGLGYYNRNNSEFNNASNLKLALTMNGEIVADRMTTGILKAITIQNTGWGNGNNKFYADLETGVIKINATELSISGSSAATQLFATNAANGAVSNLSGQTIYEKLANAGQGIYAYNGTFYINAGYIRSGTITIGGTGYGDGQLIVRDSSNAQTHKLSVDGLSSFGKNRKAAGLIVDGYSHEYTIKYGKAGYLADAKNSGSNRYYANYIGYYNNNRLTVPDAFIGYSGEGYSYNGYQTLVIQNTYSKLRLIGKTTIVVENAIASIEIGDDESQEGNGRVYIDSYTYRDDGGYGSSGNAKYFDGDGLHCQIGSTDDVRDVYFDHLYHVSSRTHRAYDYTDRLSTLGEGISQDIYYKGIDGNNYKAHFDDGILTEHSSY